MPPLVDTPLGTYVGAMSKPRNEVLEDSKRKATKAGVTAAAAIGVGIAGFPVTAVLVGVPAAVLTWRWWKHRAENGIKF